MLRVIIALMSSCWPPSCHEQRCSYVRDAAYKSIHIFSVKKPSGLIRAECHPGRPVSWLTPHRISGRTASFIVLDQLKIRNVSSCHTLNSNLNRKVFHQLRLPRVFVTVLNRFSIFGLLFIRRRQWDITLFVFSLWKLWKWHAICNTLACCWSCQFPQDQSFLCQRSHSLFVLVIRLSFVDWMAFFLKLCRVLSSCWFDVTRAQLKNNNLNQNIRVQMQTYEHI